MGTGGRHARTTQSHPAVRGRPRAPAYWLLVASIQLSPLVLLVWAAGPAVVIGRMVYRGASVLTARAFQTRLRTVLCPAKAARPFPCSSGPAAHGGMGRCAPPPA